MPILKISNLTIFYKKNRKIKTILKDLNLEIKAGEIVSVVGPSGCGKTTLAKTIVGLHKDYTGSIVFDKNFNRNQIQYIFQDPYSSLNPFASIEYIITEGMTFNSKQERELEVNDVLNKVGLDPNKKHLFPSNFSGGERQKIAIARAIIRKPKLIIADEITSSIDYFSKVMIINILKELQKESLFACLVISHDKHFLNKLTDKFIVLG